MRAIGCLMVFWALKSAGEGICDSERGEERDCVTGRRARGMKGSQWVEAEESKMCHPGLFSSAVNSQVSKYYKDKGFTMLEPECVFVTITASVEKVWKIISTPGAKIWHPYADHDEVTNGMDEFDSSGSPFDVIHYWSGRVYARWVESWHPNSGMDLIVGPMSFSPPPEPEVEMKNVYNVGRRTRFPIGRLSWRLRAIGGEGENTELALELRRMIPGGMTKEMNQFLVRAHEQADPIGYLYSCIRGVKHVAETNTPVEKNQFGPHSLYSETTSTSQAPAFFDIAAQMHARGELSDADLTQFNDIISRL